MAELVYFHFATLGLGRAECQGLRRKPGRGEPCLKASCVDKLAKWHLFGLQGKRLLACIGKSVNMDSLVIGNCVESVEFDSEALSQAMFPERIGSQSETREDDDDSDSEPASKRPKQEQVFRVNKQIPISFADEFRKDELTRTSSKRASSGAIVSWLEGISRTEKHNFKKETLI